MVAMPPASIIELKVTPKILAKILWSTACSETALTRMKVISSNETNRANNAGLSAPVVADLEAWMREQRARLSRGNDVAKAMDYMLKRWSAFTRCLDDGRICLSNNAAERGVRGIAMTDSFCTSSSRV
jgi:hypothetical protein